MANLNWLNGQFMSEEDEVRTDVRLDQEGAGPPLALCRSLPGALGLVLALPLVITVLIILGALIVC